MRFESSIVQPRTVFKQVLENVLVTAQTAKINGQSIERILLVYIDLLVLYQELDAQQVAHPAGCHQIAWSTGLVGLSSHHALADCLVVLQNLFRFGLQLGVPAEHSELLRLVHTTARS